MAPRSPHADSYLHACFFKVEIDGIAVADFREADGLSVHREVVEYQEGGENGTTHKLYGQTRWSNIVLRRGITSSTDLFNWVKKHIEAKQLERKNGSIMATDREGKVVVRWDFTNGWPCRWEGPKLSSMSREIEIECLEIAHDGFEMKKS